MSSNDAAALVMLRDMLDSGASINLDTTNAGYQITIYPLVKEGELTHHHYEDEELIGAIMKAASQHHE
jgi:hypothetical protein